MAKETAWPGSQWNPRYLRGVQSQPLNHGVQVLPVQTSATVHEAYPFENTQMVLEKNGLLLENNRLFLENNRLFLENNRLAHEAKNATIALANATLRVRGLEKDFAIRSSELRADLEHERSRNPYVAILIDGNGYVVFIPTPRDAKNIQLTRSQFSESYVGEGIEGGKAAAYKLRVAVAAACNNMPSGIEISAQIIADLEALARVRARDRALKKPKDLRRFTQGFSQFHASFGFTDIGCDERSLRLRIQENTRQHLRNSNCKQVLLGISHDADYAPFLRDILCNETTRRQVSVLEGGPTVQNLLETGVNVFEMDNDLFRDRNNYTTNNTSPKTATPSPQTTVAIPANTVQPTDTKSSLSSYANVAAKTRQASHPTQPSMLLQPQAPALPASLATQCTQKSQMPKWTPGTRGRDKKLIFSASDLEAAKKLRDGKRLCHNHLLRSEGCTKGDECTFVHSYKPSQGELNATAFLSRHNPCNMGQDCDDNNCIYGHHCPHMKSNRCTHQFCKFSIEAHPPNTKFGNSYIEYN